MLIPEGLFGNWDNNTSSIISNKGFEPTTEDYIRQCIGSVYTQGILGVKGKSNMSDLKNIRQGIFLPQP